MTRECEVIEKPGVLASTGPNAPATIFPKLPDGCQTRPDRRRRHYWLTLAGRVEVWRGVPKVWPSLLLPVSVGSASIAEP